MSSSAGGAAVALWTSLVISPTSLRAGAVKPRRFDSAGGHRDGPCVTILDVHSCHQFFYGYATVPVGVG